MWRRISKDKVKSFIHNALVYAAEQLLLASDRFVTKAQDDQYPEVNTNHLASIEPLPDFPVFEALFIQKFGHGGVLRAQLFGKQYVLRCDELYKVLDSIANSSIMSSAAVATYTALLNAVLEPNHNNTQFLN